MTNIQIENSTFEKNKPYAVEFVAEEHGGEWVISHNPEESGVEITDMPGGEAVPFLTKEFIITATKPGIHTVSLAYQRLWEDEPNERVDLVLNVVEPTAD